MFGVNKQMRWLLLKNLTLAQNIVKQERHIELFLGKESFDPNFALSISETQLFQQPNISRLKNQKYNLQFKRYENILQFIKIQELNPKFFHVHTLELSKHAFQTRWLKEDLKIKFNTKKQAIFDKIMDSLATTASLQQIRIFIESHFFP